jgi:hypothetical protein
MASPDKRHSRRATRITILLAIFLLTPGLIGFSGKFLELIHVFRVGGEGAFAVTPIVNYLCASLGFLFLLLWAARNGMFRDMENPKYLMLEREEQLDRASTPK